MFAEAPSRLQRACEALLDLADEPAAARRAPGGAGRLRRQRRGWLCPLTHDLDHFRDVVETLDARRRPDPALGGGTRIGAALVAGAGGARRPVARRATSC